MTRFVLFDRLGFGAAAGALRRRGRGLRRRFVAATGRCGAGELFSFGASPTIASATRSATVCGDDNPPGGLAGGGWWQRWRGYLARRARLPSCRSKPLAGDAIHSIRAGVGGRRGVQVGLPCELKRATTPRADADADADADAADAAAASAMACSSQSLPSAIPLRRRLLPLVAGAGCGARNVYVDLGELGNSRLFAHAGAAADELCRCTRSRRRRSLCVASAAGDRPARCRARGAADGQLASCSSMPLNCGKRRAQHSRASAARSTRRSTRCGRRPSSRPTRRSARAAACAAAAAGRRRRRGRRRRWPRAAARGAALALPADPGGGVGARRAADGGEPDDARRLLRLEQGGAQRPRRPPFNASLSTWCAGSEPLSRSTTLSCSRWILRAPRTRSSRCSRQHVAPRRRAAVGVPPQAARPARKRQCAAWTARSRLPASTSTTTLPVREGERLARIRAGLSRVSESTLISMRSPRRSSRARSRTRPDLLLADTRKLLAIFASRTPAGMHAGATTRCQRGIRRDDASAARREKIGRGATQPPPPARAATPPRCRPPPRMSGAAARTTRASRRLMAAACRSRRWRRRTRAAGATRARPMMMTFDGENWVPRRSSSDASSI